MIIFRLWSTDAPDFVKREVRGFLFFQSERRTVVGRVIVIHRVVNLAVEVGHFLLLVRVVERSVFGVALPSLSACFHDACFLQEVEESHIV